MSFLKEVQRKKALLKRTETVVTRVDGQRFVIDCNKDNCLPVPIGQIQYGFVVDAKPDRVPARIFKNIFLGSQDCCESCILLEYNIKAVLSVGIEPVFDLTPNVEHTFVACLDLPETNVLSVVRNCIPIIREAYAQDRNILIHCNAGVSRSSAVVIGFLMLEQNLSYVEAYDIVKRARNCIQPNAGFEKQLKSLTNK